MLKSIIVRSTTCSYRCLLHVTALVVKNNGRIYSQQHLKVLDIAHRATYISDAINYQVSWLFCHQYFTHLPLLSSLNYNIC